MDKNINSALSNGQQLEILAWETFIYWSALFIIFSLNMGHTVFSHGLAHIHIQRNSERNKCWIQVKELYFYQMCLDQSSFKRADMSITWLVQQQSRVWLCQSDKMLSVYTFCLNL